MSWARASLLACAVGCGNVTPANTTDAPISTDGASTCDPAARFGVPTPVMGLEATGLEPADPQLSSDELAIYFGGHLAGKDYNLYVAHRNSLAAAFGIPNTLVAENSATADDNPSVSSDGLTLWFASNRIANQPYHLYVATRSSVLADFGSPGLAATVNAADVTATDAQPFITTDNKELWFVSSRLPNVGGLDIWHAGSVSTGFAPPSPEAELSSQASDYYPTLSADRLTIYFASTRSASGVKGGFDIWSSHRSTVSDGFPAPTLVDELNTTGDDHVTWLSADNCRIYGTSTNSGSNQLFVAERRP